MTITSVTHNPELECRLFDPSEAKSELEEYAAVQLAVLDGVMASRAALDRYDTRYEKVRALCHATIRMDRAIRDARAFLMSKARRDPEEQAIVRQLSDVLAEAAKQD